MKDLRGVWPKFLQLLWIPVLGLFEYLRYEYDLMAGFRFLLILAILALIYDYLQFKKHISFFQHDVAHTSGTTTVLGMSLALAALDYDIAKAAIMMMVLGDIFAGVARRALSPEGMYWKSFLACLVGCFIAGALVLQNPVIVLLMALVASWLESRIFKLDDNLFMMLFAGLIGQLLRFALV